MRAKASGRGVNFIQNPKFALCICDWLASSKEDIPIQFMNAEVDKPGIPIATVSISSRYISVCHVRIISICQEHLPKYLLFNLSPNHSEGLRILGTHTVTHATNLELLTLS